MIQLYDGEPIEPQDQLAYRRHGLTAKKSAPSMAAYMRWYKADNVEYRLEHQAQWADKRALNGTAKLADLPFAGFDCEGATIHKCGPMRGHRKGCDDLSHEKSRLVLMVCGEVVIREPARGKGLHYYEIFDALCRYTPQNQLVVGFSNNYDIGMILATVKSPVQIVNLVANGAGMIGNDINGWWFVKYLRGLEFFISPQRRTDNDSFEADPTRGHAVRIDDTFRLFGKSFLSVIESWKAGTEEERRVVARGKDKREYVQYLDADEIAETDRYCQMECRLLEQVMTTLRQDLLNSGLHLPDRWQSPGYVARKILQQNHVMTRQEYEHRISSRLRRIFLASYYGGWFDTIVHGPAPGTHAPFLARYRQGHLTKLITQWDINSAYPWALTHAPCPRHMSIVHRAPKDGEYGLQYIKARYGGWADEYGVVYKPGTEDPDEDLPAYMGLPWRDETDGHIARPLNTEGWYWNFEVAEARHQKINVLDSYTIINNCDCDAWGFIRDLYHRRRELKKSGKDKPLKLGLNAIYGVLAQSVGGRRYAMPLFASFITAFVRAHIMRTIHKLGCERDLTCGWNVLMVATDAIFVVGDPKFEESAELGGWSKETYPEGLNIMQGGVYFTPDGTVSKTRGFPANVLEAHRQDCLDSWLSYFPETPRDDSDETTVEQIPGIQPVSLTHRVTASGERVRCKRFVGPVESVYRAVFVSENDRWFIGNLHDRLGTWEYMERRIAYDWRPKRELDITADFSDFAEPFWTVPIEVSNPKSAPYSRELADMVNQSVMTDNMDELFQHILNDTPDYLAEAEDDW